MLYVVLEEKAWGNLAVGQCTDTGDVEAVVDPRDLQPIGNAFDRDWRVVSASRNNLWAALEDLKKLRLAAMGEPVL